MLAVGVSGEEKVPCEELHDDAANRPDICYFIPFTTFHDNFRRPVLPRADHRTMRLVEKSCTTEVDNPNLVALGQPVWLVVALILQKLLFLE